MTIAITGATGFVGQAVLDEGLAQGLAFKALTRRPQPARDNVEWVVGDLDNAAALHALFCGAEAVVHIAGVVNAPDPAAFEAGNVSGTLNVIETALAQGVSRLIHVSSLSAREPTLSAYGASKARAEKLVMASGLDWTMVRPPGIYGPRDVDYFEMFRLARWGVLPVPPRQGRASILHVADLARLLLALIPGGEERSHRVFEPDDGRRNGWSHRELARAIGWSMGRRPWIVHLSKPALEWAARVDRVLRGTNARLTRDRVGYMAHRDWVVGDEGRVPADLWQPQIETRSGLKATFAWYRKQGWLR